MRRDYHNWFSSRVNRRMELLVFGHTGLHIVVFPTARGRFFDYENNGVIHALAPKIDSGQLQVFCVDSGDGESWLNRSVHPHERVLRHLAYEGYILYEVAPLMKNLSGLQQIGAAGCGLGAYHAFNFAMKHPDLISACIAMSGCFNMLPFMDGYYDNDFYFNNPFDYLANATDPWFLERYRRMRIVLAAGSDDVCLQENYRMDGILNSRGIPHVLDVWTDKQRHDWLLWERMAVKFF
jgi:esterase/lipase superfamily enzyme